MVKQTSNEAYIVWPRTGQVLLDQRQVNCICDCSWRQCHHANDDVRYGSQNQSGYFEDAGEGKDWVGREWV